MVLGSAGSDEMIFFKIALMAKSSDPASVTDLKAGLRDRITQVSTRGLIAGVTLPVGLLMISANGMGIWEFVLIAIGLLSLNRMAGFARGLATELPGEIKGDPIKVGILTFMAFALISTAVRLYFYAGSLWLSIASLIVGIVFFLAAGSKDAALKQKAGV